MTPENKKVLYLVSAVAAAGLFFAYFSRRSGPASAVTPAADAGFNSPYFWPTPGIYPDPSILNGSTVPFESTVNVYVENPAISQLSNQYIPMFGFVGMTAVGA